MEIPGGGDSQITRSFDEDWAIAERSLFRDYIEAGYYVAEPIVETIPDASDYAKEEIAEMLEPYFRFFSKEDLDLIYLNFMGKKTQVDLRVFFDKSQPAICTNAYRIRETAEVVSRLGNALDEFCEFLASPDLKLDYRDRNILTVFFYSTSITKTAQLLGITPMLCRARVEKALERLKGLGRDSIYSYFQYILENLNKVKKEVTAVFAERAPANRDYPSGRVAQTLPFALEET